MLTGRLCERNSVAQRAHANRLLTDTAEMPTPPPLVVEFAEQVTEVGRGLTFGRAGDLELDSNPHLHRLVGEFVQRNGEWWVRNLGSRLFLTLVSDDGTRIELAPRSGPVLLVRSGVIRISVGPARYKVAYRIGTAPIRARSQLRAAGATSDFDAVLTPREVDFLVSFAKPILDGTNGPIMSYAEVAGVWGVATKTLDNTLQGVKRKLRRARLFRDEPLETLVRIAISHSLVTLDDLRWADLESGRPRSSGDGPRFNP